jgi:hypothetical protein
MTTSRQTTRSALSESVARLLRSFVPAAMTCSHRSGFVVATSRAESARVFHTASLLISLASRPLQCLTTPAIRIPRRSVSWRRSRSSLTIPRADHMHRVHFRPAPPHHQSRQICDFDLWRRRRLTRRCSAGWRWHVRIRGRRHWSGVAELGSLAVADLTRAPPRLA